MRKGDATRESIVDEALAQAVHVGLKGLSLGALAESLALSKSGLFAHFKSKEALQLAVLDEAVKRFMAHVAMPVMKIPEGRARLEALFKLSLRWMKGEADLDGCPFMVIAYGLGPKESPLRDKLVASQEEWQAFIASTVSGAIKVRDFKSEVEPAQFAFEFIGLCLAYQRALKLGLDRSALSRANRAFEGMVERASAR
jgi:AcrR family transcriptional regulator